MMIADQMVIVWWIPYCLPLLLLSALFFVVAENVERCWLQECHPCRNLKEALRLRSRNRRVWTVILVRTGARRSLRKHLDSNDERVREGARGVNYSER